MADFPWDVVGHGISGVASIINTAQINKNNLRIARETNEANRQMVEMQNKAAREEAEKAYQRSSAPNQVELMRSAGMSRAGAINALNGGGSYTPAPVNTSQDSAPQMQTADLSAFSNMAQAITANKQMKQTKEITESQMNQQKQIADEQLKEQKRQFDAELQFERDKWNEEKPTRDATLTSLQFQNRINEALENYKDEHGKKHNLLVEGVAAQRLADMAEAKLNQTKYELINSLVELPSHLALQFLNEIKDSLKDGESLIKKIRGGEADVNEVENFNNNDIAPTYIRDGRKTWRLIKKENGDSYWIEVGN